MSLCARIKFGVLRCSKATPWGHRFTHNLTIMFYSVAHSIMGRHKTTRQKLISTELTTLHFTFKLLKT
ncbi:hypothetical protein Csa_021449 [Cucumis sativus]|uniref:Uncharacterized protein n=1 Tax=Cucumis sativus TaxID=3659 RepID=A0A0A0KLW3_CUCSA|nr:hypothetical protein Csa_021449 [Cucumis sativus]